VERPLAEVGQGPPAQRLLRIPVALPHGEMPAVRGSASAGGRTSGRGMAVGLAIKWRSMPVN